jgi:PEP-CTERM motif
MRKGRLIATCVGLALLSAPGWAGILDDPAAQIDAGSASNPFFGTGIFNPAGDPGTPGIIALYNATPGFLTSIFLDTTIASGLLEVPGFVLNQTFTCAAAPFFQQCIVNYNDSNGDLSFSFINNLPVLRQSSDPGGIPPLRPGCLPPGGNPDGEGCTGQGHFAFNFLDPGTGVDGWEVPNNVLFPNGPPIFNGTSTDSAVPEPGTWAMMLAGMLAAAFLSRNRLVLKAQTARAYFSRNN